MICLLQTRDYSWNKLNLCSGSPWWPNGDEDFFAKRLVATLIGGLKLAGSKFGPDGFKRPFFDFLFF